MKSIKNNNLDVLMKNLHFNNKLLHTKIFELINKFLPFHNKCSIYNDYRSKETVINCYQLEGIYEISISCMFIKNEIKIYYN
jgi:hypothetical protein